MPDSLQPTPASHRSIVTRVLVLQGLGWVASLLVIGGASWASVSALQEQLLADREMVAVEAADRIDRALGRVLEMLQQVASSPHIDLADDDPAPEREALQQAVSRSGRLDVICLLDGSGRPIMQEPSRVRVPLEALSPIGLQAMRTARPVFAPHQYDAQQDRLIVVAVPLGTSGAVLAIVDPLHSSFAPLLHAFDPSHGGALDFIDHDGQVIFTSTRGATTGPPPAAYADLARARHPWHGRLTVAGESLVAGFGPLSLAPWGIVIRQPEAGVFVPIVAGRYSLWALVPLLAVLAAVFAWGTAVSVRRALQVLRRAAERIAAGDLARPIPKLPDDEVGRLGRAFEEMRIALKGSLDELERVNQGLEQRVAERTRELEEICLRLRDREQWRGQLLRKVISAQEDERRRIARELHDDTCQALAALSMGVETALPGLPAGEAYDRLVELKRVVVRALDELHRVIMDLRPSVLDDLGLSSAIQWYAEHRLTANGVSVRCEFSGIERRFVPEVETAIFRVVQEAVSNITRHAQADAVLIQCAVRDGLLTIDVEDDGQGFDPAALKPSHESSAGLGLLGMRERVELLGGSMLIDSAPGQGVHISVTVPVGEDEGAAVAEGV